MDLTSITNRILTDGVWFSGLVGVCLIGLALVSYFGEGLSPSARRNLTSVVALAFVAAVVTLCLVAFPGTTSRISGFIWRLTQG